MKRAFKKIGDISTGKEWTEYTVITGNDIMRYTIATTPFGFYSSNAIEIGYPNIKEYIKTLKKRGFIGVEISISEQRKDLLRAFIKLGCARIAMECDFEDVCDNMGTYLGIGRVAAQNMIMEKYASELLDRPINRTTLK
jgi:hypothetical protein